MTGFRLKSVDGEVVALGTSHPDWRKKSRYLYVSFGLGMPAGEVGGIDILDDAGKVLDFYPIPRNWVSSYILVTVGIPKKHLRSLQ